MTLLEQTAKEAAQGYVLDKRRRPDKIGAIKYIRHICGVDLRTAVRALEAALTTKGGRT